MDVILSVTIQLVNDIRFVERNTSGYNEVVKVCTVSSEVTDRVCEISVVVFF